MIDGGYVQYKEIYGSRRESGSNGELKVVVQAPSMSSDSDSQKGIYTSLTTVIHSTTNHQPPARQLLLYAHRCCIKS